MHLPRWPLVSTSTAIHFSNCKETTFISNTILQSYGGPMCTIPHVWPLSWWFLEALWRKGANLLILAWNCSCRGSLQLGGLVVPSVWQQNPSFISCALSLENYMKGGNIWMMRVHIIQWNFIRRGPAVGRYLCFASLVKPDSHPLFCVGVWD